ncbi:MAG: hypothetical protein SOR93_19180 [Clostridiales Family XIII bacterium]|uniref:Uncharacterized protein n=1 Tax=Hominibacterium faecale TaxID=2839743 RepID=A0A9J6QVL6_9FIRM|nr:hypothetical protein [Hominibacterium faecale]MCI7304499.1 hypothetical protein [Clostridia bacterium]MCU7376826.1 hypothetical protein [Hominibacterium faecale]MCU7379375.1 hypothetical protein [Hominibacterium faecale]MDY3013367.1 hypothetical protein [Clostridiales Family XIII bacterium]
MSGVKLRLPRDSSNLVVVCQVQAARGRVAARLVVRNHQNEEVYFGA